ncbi:threonylcarbamoyl-AMP synthase [Mycoplasmatota bacterium]|nr:threonylcarbamoyl-AMP synthase [Mycoplasmatota bacterium]
MKKISIKSLNSFNLEGKIIAFPTDTIYGVGALINDKIGIDKIYSIKNRDYSKPLAVLISDLSELPNLIEDPELVEKVSNFWPGPITFIFKKKNVPSFITSGLNTVGIRIPNSEVALSVLKRYGPLAVTSVNLSGEHSAKNIEEVMEFDIDYVITEKENSIDIASTIVDISTNPPLLLREGAISYKDLQSEFPNIRKN